MAEQGIKVLGLPVCYPGSHEFALQLLTEVVDSLEHSCRVLSHLGDAQTEQLLLRYCLDACRVTHFLRAVDCETLKAQVAKASQIIRRTLEGTVGIPLSEEQWV